MSLLIGIGIGVLIALVKPGLHRYFHWREEKELEQRRKDSKDLIQREYDASDRILAKKLIVPVQPDVTILTLEPDRVDFYLSYDFPALPLCEVEAMTGQELDRKLIDLAKAQVQKWEDEYAERYGAKTPPTEFTIMSPPNGNARITLSDLVQVEKIRQELCEALPATYQQMEEQINRSVENAIANSVERVSKAIKGCSATVGEETPESKQGEGK